jgi:hypothetical protein
MPAEKPAHSGAPGAACERGGVQVRALGRAVVVDARPSSLVLGRVGPHATMLRRMGALLARASHLPRPILAPILVLVACSRPTAPAPPDAASLAAPASPAPDAQVQQTASHAAAPRPFTSPPGSGEARRKTLARLDAEPVLAPHLGKLQEHFGDKAKGPFLLQRVALANGRVAVLVSLAPDEANPIVLVIEHDALVWVKEHPTGGIAPPVKGLALTPHPDGGAMLFAFVPAVATVAGRIWADDGGAFADLEVLHLDDCEGLSAAYTPGLGWVVVAARRAGARAQRVRESATLAWGTGIDLGAPWRRAAPVAIAFDTPSSVVFAQFTSLGHPATDHLVASRYDAAGQALWPSSVDLGAALAVPKGSERPESTAGGEGTVHVEAPGVFDGGASSIEVDSSGRVR